MSILFVNHWEICKRFGGKHLLPRSGEKGLLEPRKQIVKQYHKEDRLQECNCSKPLHIN